MSAAAASSLSIPELWLDRLTRRKKDWRLRFYYQLSRGAKAYSQGSP